MRYRTILNKLYHQLRAQALLVSLITGMISSIKRAKEKINAESISNNRFSKYFNIIYTLLYCFATKLVFCVLTSKEK